MTLISGRNKQTKSNIQNVSILVLPFKYYNIACNRQNVICIKRTSSGASRLVNTGMCWCTHRGLKAPRTPVFCFMLVFHLAFPEMHFFFNRSRILKFIRKALGFHSSYQVSLQMQSIAILSYLDDVSLGQKCTKHN